VIPAMGENNKQQGDASERRNFFRIDDSVSMSYHPVPEEEVEDRLRRMESEVAGNFTVMSSLSSINQNMAGILHRIEKDTPDVADYLKAINQKIEVLGRALLSADTELTEKPAQPVNLSASGLAFYSEEPIEPGLVLELRLLLPSFTGIITYGEVIGCDRVENEAPGFPYFSRINFLHMREKDRDLLIRHVIKRQSDMLRQRREQREELSVSKT